ncbi:hypothetical protein [Arthrobacter terrae]|nr:hypothetical protein [Arthrobacter terrae]
MVEMEMPGRMLREKGGRTWRIGTAADVAWIVQKTAPPGLSITVAIPEQFAAYATIVVPRGETARSTQAQVVMDILSRNTAGQPWWLGYLDTGDEDVVFPDVPQVKLYAGWSYVVVEAGPQQASTWRSENGWFERGPVPDIVFPADRSWLLSTLWDDDWRCFGGPGEVVAELLREPSLVARAVLPGEDATPPGHVAR